MFLLLPFSRQTNLLCSAAIWALRFASLQGSSYYHLAFALHRQPGEVQCCCRGRPDTPSRVPAPGGQDSFLGACARATSRISVDQQISATFVDWPTATGRFQTKEALRRQSRPSSDRCSVRCMFCITYSIDMHSLYIQEKERTRLEVALNQVAKGSPGKQRMNCFIFKGART